MGPVNLVVFANEDEIRALFPEKAGDYADLARALAAHGVLAAVKMGKDGAVTLHSLGWTSAWSQDADLILGAEREPGAPIIRLRVVAGRQVSPTEITVAVNWEESRFEEVELGESEDYE